MRCVIILLPVN